MEEESLSYLPEVPKTGLTEAEKQDLWKGVPEATLFELGMKNTGMTSEVSAKMGQNGPKEVITGLIPTIVVENEGNKGKKEFYNGEMMSARLDEIFKKRHATEYLAKRYGETARYHQDLKAKAMREPVTQNEQVMISGLDAMYSALKTKGAIPAIPALEGRK